MIAKLDEVQRRFCTANFSNDFINKLVSYVVIEEM